MTLDQHINVVLVVNNSGLTQQGFGTSARLTYNAPWTDPSRTYRKRSEAIADGFPSDSPEVRFLTSVFSQSPRPPLAKLIRGTRPPTQRYTLVATPSPLKLYQVDAVGQGFAADSATYTSDSSPTQAKIHSNLVDALNAVDDNTYLAAFPLVAFTDFTFTVPDPTNDQLHAVAHGRQTGDGPIQLTNAGGALPAGSALATPYWLIRVGPDDLKIATSLALALAGTAVDLTGVGTGVHTVQHQATTASPSTSFSVTADAPGDWFALSVANTKILSIAQDHADPGITDDLDDAAAADNDWYYLSIDYRSKAMLKGAAAWVEATPFKAFVAESSDSEAENTALGGGGTLEQINAFGYIRTTGAYHRKPAEMTTDGWVAGLAALPVGTWTAAYKPVIGSTPDSFVSNQTSNLDLRRASYYKTEAGRAFMWEGKVGALNYGFLDVTVSLDFVLDLIQKRGFALFLALPKLPATDEGIAMMRGTIQGAIDVCASDAHKIIALGTPGDPNDPQPTVTFPRVRDIDPLVRAQRILPDGDVFFRLQTAFHHVDVNVTVVF